MHPPAVPAIKAQAAAWLVAEHGRFVLWLPLAMGAGTLVYFALGSEPPAGAAAAALAAASLGTVLLRRRPAGRAAALAALFASLGFASATLATRCAPRWDSLPRHALQIEGRVAAVELLPAGRRLTLAAPTLDGGAPQPRALRIRLRRNDPVQAEAGETIRVRALVEPPAAPAYPGAWDSQREAFFTGIGGYGYALGPATRRAAAAAGPVAWLRGLRDRIAGRAIAALPGPRGAIAATLLAGRGAAIPQADRLAFQTSGLSHLLAVAGLHVGIVMGISYWVTRFGLALSERAALRLPCKAIAGGTALFLGGLYLLLTGAHLPILRSFAMASLVTLGIVAGRRALSLRGLALAATLLLLFAPAELMGASFQLSFSAVLALIAGFDALRPWLDRLRGDEWWRRAARITAGLALTSFLAGGASAPFAAYHFGQASLYTVPANMLAVPLTAFWVMPWGLAALLLMPAGLDPIAFAPMGVGINGLLRIAHAVACWPAARLAVPAMPGGALVLIALGLAWLGLWRSRWRLAGAGAIAAGLLWAALAPLPDLLITPNGRLIAARARGQVWVAASGHVSPFDAQAPLRVWGVAKSHALPGAFPPLSCDAASCRLHAGAADAILLLAPAAATPPAAPPTATNCTGASIVLAMAWRVAGCEGVLTLSRQQALRDGAATVRLTAAGPVVMTDRAWRGDRPWVLLGPAPLPAAVTE